MQNPLWKLLTKFILMLGKKIIIIGVGRMGLSHLKSLYKLNIKIYLFDKSKNITKYLKHNKIKISNNLIIVNKIPNNEKFDLCIISTKSNSRFEVFKLFMKTNK